MAALMRQNVKLFSLIMNMGLKNTKCDTMIKTCRLSLLACTKWTANSPAANSFHTTSTQHGLMEFFDEKDNWDASKVQVGRPWEKDELRLKSNTDLHKLWYVLLKERNMILTMEAEYKRLAELMPSPERLEKVEMSMENLLDVVSERDRAYNLLETGETGEPGRRWKINQLGLGYWHKQREHYKPPSAKEMRQFVKPWQFKYLKLYREQILQRRSKNRNKRLVEKENFKNIFPNSEID